MGNTRVDKAFHPKGDIILVVGRDHGKVTQFRVDATELKAASPVFRALLERSFKEGTSLQSSTSSRGFEIELPDDDAGGLQLAFTIIWMKELPKATTTSIKAYFKSDPTLPSRTVVMADKYCMRDLVREFYESNIWPEMKVMDDIWEKIKIACLLKSEYVFRRSTSYVLYNYAGPFRDAIGQSHNQEWAEMIADSLTRAKKREVEFFMLAVVFPAPLDPSLDASDHGTATSPGANSAATYGNNPGHASHAYWALNNTGSSTKCQHGCLGCKWIERLSHVRSYSDYAKTDLEIRKVGDDLENTSLSDLLKGFRDDPLPIDSSRWYNLEERPTVLQARKDRRQHHYCQNPRYRILSRYRDKLQSRVKRLGVSSGDLRCNGGLCMHCVFSSMPDLGLSGH